MSLKSVRTMYGLCLTITLTFLISANIGIVFGATCYNICEWLSWFSWSSCSQTCGGGSRSRDRHLCCRRPIDIVQCISDCGKTNSGFYDYEDCNEFCYNGGTFSGWRCSCEPGYYDSCCASRITCGTPPTIQNGGYTGSNYDYNDIVTYSCDTHYNMTSGTSIRSCLQSWSNSGYWSGTTPTCQYVRTCLSNPCQNGGACVDGVEKYTCLCEDGWSGTNCEFDIIPPKMSGCSGNITRVNANPTLQMEWPVPKFSDPRGTELVITSNYLKNHSTFSWGEYGIQYVADKPSNGLRTVCLFHVNFYPIPCEKINPPENGSVASNGWNSRFTEVSTVFCKEGFHFDIFNKLDTVYVCGGSGQWLPPVPVDLKCREIEPSPNDQLPLYHYNDFGEISNKYMMILASSDMSDMCTSPQWDGQCTEENVSVRSATDL